MCQPQSRGGRRCPNHQPGTVGTSKFVVENYGLTKEQAKGTFVNLRAQGQGMPAPTVEQYEHFKQRQLQILENSNLDETTKNKIRTQLNRRLNSEQLPDGATFYAQKKMIARSREQKREFVGMIKQIAEAQNVNRREARQLFDERYEQLSAIPGVTNPGDRFDRRTLAAVATLTSRNAETGQRLTSESPRIQRQDVSDRSTWVHEIGYDPDDGRLEIKTQNSDKVYAYHNVPRRMWQKISNGDEMGSTISREIFRNPLYAYESAEAAERDSSGRWCYDCHSYRAVSGHTCIPRDLRQAGEEDSTDTIANTSSDVSDERTSEDTLRSFASEEVQRPDDKQEKRDYQSALSEMKQRLAMQAEEESQGHTKSLLHQAWNTDASERERVIVSHDDMRQIRSLVMRQGKVVQVPFAARARSEFSSEVVRGHLEVWAEGDNGVIRTRGTSDENMSEAGRQALQAKFDEESTSFKRDLNFAEYLNEQEDTGIVKMSASLYSYNSGYYRTENGYASLDLPESATLKKAFQILEDKPTMTVSFGSLKGQNYGSFPGIGSEYGELVEGLDTDKDFVMFTADDGNVAFGVGSEKKCWRARCHEQAPCPIHSEDRAIIQKIFEQGMSNTVHWHSEREDDGIPNAGELAMMSASEKLERLNKLDSESWTNKAELVAQYESHFASNQMNGLNANIDTYLEDIHAAEAQIKQNGSALPFYTDNATDGFCSPESGRGFGIELEYDLPSDKSHSEVMQAIAEELYDAGLSDIDYGTEYHEYDGDKWHIEDDCTVAGEVVSPILHDTPEHWEQVAKVCEIIKRHGGKATASTGGHVHMGLKTDNQRPGLVKASLVQLFAAHQDSIMRVNTNPDRKKHRGTEWCDPLDKDAAKSQIYDFVQFQADNGDNDHNVAMNLAYSNRVEFRSGDGSLDPGHIQAQVMLSAALMRKAEVSSHIESDIPFNEVGTNAQRSALLGYTNSKERSDDQIIVEDYDFRKTVDDLFADEKGRKMMTYIAAANPWQERND